MNLTCFLAFSLASVSFGNGLKDLLHKRHIAHESQGWLREVQECWFNQHYLFYMVKKVTLKY